MYVGAMVFAGSTVYVSGFGLLIKLSFELRHVQPLHTQLVFGR